jgi:hypothetical protein
MLGGGECIQLISNGQKRITDILYISHFILRRRSEDETVSALDN